MKRSDIYIYSLSFLAVLAPLGEALAQTVDYGNLQALFGEPVTTSAAGIAQRTSDVPANMTIITADEIRQSGSRSIPQILSRVPGLDILQTSATMYDVGVRGYQQPYQPRLLVLIDGRQVFIDDYSRTPWQNLPVNIDDIRQIEVVKGAASALFGSNAAGGVVNIITYNPLYDNNKVANITSGTQQNISGDATFTQHFGDWGGTKISVGGMSEDAFNTPKMAEDSTFNNRPAHQYVTESSIFKVNPDLQTNLEATYSNSKADGGFPGNSLGNVVDTSYSLKGGFALQTPYGMITNNNYFNYNSSLTAFSISPHFNGVTNLLVSNLEDQFRANSDHTFRVALEYRRKTITQNAGNSVDPIQNNELNDNVFTASGTWVWQINDKLSWTNAARIDHSAISEGGTIDPNFAIQDYNNSINAFSDNSGMIYQATSLDTFRATYGRGVQLPSLVQNASSFAVPLSGSLVYDVEGNPGLKPTIVENYELGYDRALPSILSTAKFSVYYENNKDLISPPANIVATRSVNSQTWFLIQSQNEGSSHGVGSEIQLTGKSPDGFRWDTSYSWSSVADASTVATALDYTASAPENHFRLLLGYTAGQWEFDTNGQYVTSTNMLRLLNNTASQKVPTSGYTSLSARIGYNLTDNYTIALSGTNLSRADTVENPYPAIERQVFLGLTGKF